MPFTTRKSPSVYFKQSTAVRRQVTLSFGLFGRRIVPGILGGMLCDIQAKTFHVVRTVVVLAPRLKKAKNSA